LDQTPITTQHIARLINAHFAKQILLDHAHDNEVARAYDRGERFDERTKLFNRWGEQLSAAQRGATIIPLKTKTA
jgi:hypothetical protein